MQYVFLHDSSYIRLIRIRLDMPACLHLLLLPEPLGKAIVENGLGKPSRNVTLENHWEEIEEKKGTERAKVQETASAMTQNSMAK